MSARGPRGILKPPVVLYDAQGAATTAQAASLQKASNLSDVADTETARLNLGIRFDGGDGSDGPGVFDGTTTSAGCVKDDATHYHLTRPVFYSTFAISALVSLDVRNFPIWCQGALDIGTGCHIHADGGSPANFTGGVASAAGYYNGGTSGGDGGHALGYGAGSASASITASVFGSGGAGGAGGAGTGGSGGAAGTVTALSDATGRVHSVAAAAHPVVFSPSGVTAWKTGTGGGGGAGDGASAFGGAGGGAGGVLVIHAPAITGHGNLHARGGDGQQGDDSGGQTGGGGGGGGGLVALDCQQLAATVTIDAAAGSGGIGLNGGSAGGDGSAGIVLKPTP